MDCCGSSKPEEKNENIKEYQTANGKNPVEKEQVHGGGGCCGGSSTGMWMHLIFMIIVILVIAYVTKR